MSRPDLTRPADDFEALVHRHLRADEIVREGDALAKKFAASIAHLEAHANKLRASTPA